MKKMTEQECHNKYCCTCCPECYPDESPYLSKEKLKEKIEWKIKQLEDLKKNHNPNILVNYLGCDVAIANFKWLMREMKL